MPVTLTERGKQLRRDIIKLSSANGGYHYGGSFSCVEILSTLFDYVLKENDEFILSKGHAAFAYYVLLKEAGYSPKLQGHPSRDIHNGIPATTGSLGHGLPVALGMALARKMQNKPGKVYVLLGDGECQEGTLWESLLIAAHHRLDNICAIVDSNGIQGSGFVKDIIALPNLTKVAKNMGWYATDVEGHNIDALIVALTSPHRSIPKLINACTVKGAGVSFMENNPSHHAHWLNPEEKEKALKELAVSTSI